MWTVSSCVERGLGSIRQAFAAKVLGVGCKASTQLLHMIFASSQINKMAHFFGCMLFPLSGLTTPCLHAQPECLPADWQRALNMAFDPHR